MRIKYVYYYAALEGSEQAKVHFELETLRTSIESLKALGTDIETLLITNSAFARTLRSESLDSIIIDDEISLSNLDYKRVLNQKQVVKEQVDRADSTYLAFIDHDIIFSSDIAPFFTYDFDFGVTANFSTEFAFDPLFLPINTGVASINAGVQLCKPSPQSLLFMNKKIEMCQWAEENRNSIPTPLNASPLSWGCDQISMMLLLNRDIFINHRTSFEVEGAKIRAFGTNILNYSPNLGGNILLSEFRDHFIWHFKGNRKIYMTQFWNALKSAGMI